MKCITSRSDLAVNGAPPAFDQPLHVGRPNIGDRETFLRMVADMLSRRWLTNDGPLVQELEQRLARLLDVTHCVAVCNGTIALEIAIRALGLSGEVIVPSYTFIATAHALYWQGITPVFADIDPKTHNLDVEAVSSMITPRTSAIIPVHLWGRPAPVRALQALADSRGLRVLYDAAHAFGCSFDGRCIGGFGSAEVLSFHATKFFNTFEGGAIVTNDDSLAQRARLMRNFGFSGYDNVIHPGTNGKMIEVCAAMGLTNLQYIANMIKANRANYDAYVEALKPLAGITLLPFDHAQRNNYQYVVMEVGEQCPVSRDAILDALHAENILARRYFWPGCHRMQPYRDLYPHAGLVLSNTNRVADRVIVLPTGTTLPRHAPEVIASVIATLSKEPRRAHR
jgi:dTDP-4-amino-4,6-dideoxygalactose transaminase